MSLVDKYVEELAGYVAAGAAWLDENKGDWVDLIDLGSLDMESHCILDQVFDLEGGFCWAVNHFGMGDVVRLGFGSSPRLHPEWTKIVTERRAAQADPCATDKET